jgi:hypothetical protein
MTLQDVLIMDKEYGDARADWGRTRDERNRAAVFLAIFEEAQEERRFSKLHDSVQGGKKTDEQGRCYNAHASGEKVLYDDEPQNMKELLAHTERDEIKKSEDAEIQQLIDQKVGVIVKKWKVRRLVAWTVDPRFSVESYDLSCAFLGTELRDRAVYVRLPAEAGEYVGEVLLLLKSVYGLKTLGRRSLYLQI